MTQQEYLQSRPDLQNNWNNIMAYRANPNDPRWANDPNVKSLSDSFGTLDQYLRADYGSDFTPTVAGSSTGNAGTGFSDLVVPNTPQLPNTPVQQAQAPAVGGGNYNQVQNANQAGQFTTTGNSVEQATGTTSQTGQQTQTGTTSQTQSGSSTSTPVDTLNLGSLITGQAQNTAASDETRRAFLTDLIQTGGTGFNEQLDAGIRQSLTGPQMTGAGDSARARAAGYAAANVGRNNMNQRLAGAEQLGGGTGLSSLVQASSPYVGQKTESTGNSLTSELNNLASSSTGFSDLITKASEATSGATTGQSSQAGAGQIPQGQPVKTGGCVLCTAGIAMKLPRSKLHRVLRRVINYKLNVDRSTYENAARGYFAIFSPIARKLMSHPRLACALFPLARATVYEELRISGRRLRFRWVPWMVHGLGHTGCAIVGSLFPVAGHVTDPVINDVARRENIIFNMEGL